MKPASELIEIVARYTLPLQIFSGLLLLIPQQVLDRVGIDQVVSQYHWLIVLVFLLTVSFSISWALNKSVQWISINIAVRNFQNRLIKNLKSLTSKEKQVLKIYIEQDTQSQNLSYLDGIAAGLENKHIIYGANPVVTIYGRAYNIQPFAFEYLKKHNWLLEE